jgi:hypothetical protein
MYLYDVEVCTLPEARKSLCRNTIVETAGGIGTNREEEL